MKRRTYVIINEEFIDTVKQGDMDNIQILVEEGADINRFDQNGWTSLHYAADNGYVDVVRFLLEKGAHIYNEVFPTYAMHIAAYHGYIEVVNLFLEYDVDINTCDPSSGNTLLHEAAGEGHVDVAEYLIENGASLNVMNRKGEEPIHTAAKNGQKDVVELLVEFGVDPNTYDFDGYTALHMASQVGHLDIVQYLIENEADIDAQSQGKTPLHLAFKWLNTDIIKCLLEAGANYDIKDHEGRTVLFYFIYDYVRYSTRYDYVRYSTRYVYFPFAQEIFEKINNYIDIDDQKKTAAHIAIKGRCDMEFLKLVLQKQKDINIEDINGNTPLNTFIEEWSVEQGDKFVEVVRLLIDKGAYLKTIDCQRIIAHPSLRNTLFTDMNLCTQSIVNKFNNKYLPILYGLSLSVPLPSIEKMKVNSSQIRKIEHAVEAEIRNEGYCDVSNMIPTLSMLSVESYVSQYNICG